MFSDEGLGTFYKMNFELITDHKGFDLPMIYDMIPWERDIHISMLMAKLQKEANNG